MKNKTLLYLSLILISITLLVRWQVENTFANVERNEKFIASAIKSQVAAQEFAMIPVLDSLSLFGNISITSSSKIPYPFFIYEKGELQFWSDFKFIPDFSDFTGNERYQFLDESFGKFIVRKWEVNFQNQAFEVYSLVTLVRKYPINNLFIQSGLNPKIGQKGAINISSAKAKGLGHVVGINGNPVCKIRLEKGYKPSIVLPIIYIDFFLLILQVVLYFSLYRIVIGKNRVVEIATIIMGWAYFKLALPLLEGTTVFARINLFDPQYYAVSWFERSMADLLINTVFILIVSFRIGFWAKDKNFLSFMFHSKNKVLSQGIVFVLTLVTFWIINYPFFQLRSIYDNSQVSVDISQSLQFGWTRIITLLIVIVVSLSTFLFYHSVASYLTRFIPNFKSLLVYLLLAMLAFLSLSYLANMPFGNLAIVNIVLIIGIWYFDFTRSLNIATYKRFLYVVLFFGMVSGSSAYFIQTFETQSKVLETKNVLEKKLAKSDPFAEFLLSTSLLDLSNDQFIISRFSSPFLSKNTVISKIRQVFLNSYLNKYDQSIVLFDAKGQPLKATAFESNLFERIKELKSSSRSTEYKTVFRINNDKQNFSKQYLGYTPIKKNNLLLGYVLVKLVEKQFSSGLVYPSLLVDNRFGLTPPNKTSFSYYLKGQMVNTVGAVEFPLTYDHKPDQTWYKEDFLYVSASDEDRSIIASLPVNKRKIILSNFSFIWILTLFPVLFVWFVIPFFRSGEMKSLTYTERIVWYLNLAFVIPLVLVTTVTFRLLSNSFETESNLAKTIIVERLTTQISSRLANYLKSPEEFDRLAERIELLADNTELDLNLFDLDGNLISSSQPGVFNKKLLAPYISQYALTAIKEKGKNHLVLQESIDNLLYRNSYVSVKSEDTGQMLGIISVPFFGSNTGLNASKREAFNTILNVFVIVLFTTMLITYFAGKWLTKPLKIIGEKLKSTSFAGQPDPINIHSDDELGLLIKAYNQMLSKLEVSRIELKQSEKEKAWREAAQQVAHEIKNPLTPMKLTLQRLNNKIKKDDAKPSDLEFSIQSVLHQVDTLNSIASSFSEFAKMPAPKAQRIEVHAIICEVIELFSAEKSLKIKLLLANKEVYSMLDPKLLGRMLNNLILNSKQSIRENQDYVELEIKTEIGDYLKISLSDNGSGIEEDIEDKVFIPKFTTKEQGSGIGLAMTKFGVENMHGKIYFSSDMNVGTTFTIEFPIID